MEREHGFLDAQVLGHERLRDPLLGERLPDRAERRDTGPRDPRRLAHEWHGARSARVCFQDVDASLADGELHVHEPDDAQVLGQRKRLT